MVMDVVGFQDLILLLSVFDSVDPAAIWMVTARWGWATPFASFPAGDLVTNSLSTTTRSPLTTPAPEGSALLQSLT